MPQHAREMGHDPNKEPPFFFQKNPDNVRTDGKFPYPPGTKDVHFEIELVVALKSGGVDIKTEDAMKHVWGYGVGLDMTRRDLQGKAKDLGRPWEVGKAFEHSAPMTSLVPAEKVANRRQGRHLARRQRQAPPDRRSQSDDLGHPRPDRLHLEPVRIESR